MQMCSSLKNMRKKGTRYLPFKCQVLVSSGLHSLDSIMGGGFPLGTMNLFEETESGSVSELMLKYFLGEGIFCGHGIFFASLQENAHKYMRTLPGINNIQEHIKNTPREENVEIPLNYTKCSVISDTIEMESDFFNHPLDHSIQIPEHYIDKSKYYYWPPTGPCDKSYKALLTYVQYVIDANQFVKRGIGQKSILRFGIHGVGSNLWSDSIEHLAGFLYELRKIVHDSDAVAVIMLTNLTDQDNYYVSRVEHVCDYVFSSQTSDDSASPFCGTLELKKVPRKNSLAPHVPPDFKWNVDVQKGTIMLEKLHLPPDDNETTATSTEAPKDNQYSGCADRRSSLHQF